MGERSVRKALKQLELHRLIRRTRRWAKDGGRRTSDLIELLVPKAE